MRKHLLRVLLGASVAALISFPIAAQTNGSSSSDNGVKGQAGAADTHVKGKTTSQNMPDKKVAPPESKGGPKAKGPWGTCNVHIDNRTALYVNIYMNGEFMGTVGPWGDLYPNITPGQAELYGRAEFTDGSSLTFGPRGYRCSGSDFHWSLLP